MSQTPTTTFSYMKHDVQRPEARTLQTPCDRNWTMRPATAQEMALPACKVCQARAGQVVNHRHLDFSGRRDPTRFANLRTKRQGTAFIMGVRFCMPHTSPMGFP